ncbi:glycosyltransferase [Candidatus Mycosynbacter amalyticus]|uniref:Glycosyltransferase n=1 Tax=Candidatus Mycosynbacter amalyticus TaxID=2665156 RepID=A0A857MLT7_9BACT|nr:glycosyltransferase family 4 protein [Candidatus Mycosynbacter amalyticus]QHN43068.1 glycosyltransferase [Candidatus Mycosynbacter amalyticus]
MKLLFVSPYYAPSVGGVQQYVADLVAAYKLEHEIIIVTTSPNHDSVTKKVEDGIVIYYLPVLRTIANTPYHPRWKSQLKEIFDYEAPDVINAHAPVPWFADMAERANRGTYPFVLTYHAGSMKKGRLLPDIVIRLYERFVLPRTLRAASKLVAVYPPFITQILGNSRQVHHITPGIATDFFTPSATPAMYDALFVGRLERTSEWKGVDVALAAVAELAKRGQHITLAIAGDGDARTQYTLRADELGIASQVTFLGSCDRTRLRDVYRASKFVVLPSKTEAESFGMVVAEAASCGIPAIGSRVGGVPYVIDDGETGILVEPGSIESLADAMSWFLTDDEWRTSCGAAARERATHLFALQNTTESTEKVLANALRSPHPKNLQIVAYYPPALGGMERVAENVALELADSGETVEVVTSSIGFEPDYHDEIKDGYHVSRLPGVMLGGLPVIPSLFWHLLRQPRGSIYHVHVAQAFMPEVAYLASRLRGGTFVAHFHLDVVPSGMFGQLFVLYKQLLFPRMLQHADKVIVFSEDQRELVMRKYQVDHTRVHIVPNGIRRGFQRLAPRTTLSSTPRLLFVGRLSHQKNLSYLLDALDGISDKFSTHIVGDGELRPELEQQAATLNLHNVAFVGRKDDDDLRQEYDNADIFVLPSEREGMPLVLIDAMAMRLPAIGTDVLGTRDMIEPGKNGQLVPLDQPAAFRQALLDAIASDADYARMSDDAYEYVRELAWPHLTRRLITEVYS